MADHCSSYGPPSNSSEDNIILVENASGGVRRANDAYTIPIQFQCTSAVLQLLICVYSVVGNGAMFYRRGRAVLWYDQRPLYLGVFVANSVAALARVSATLLKIANSFSRSDRVHIYQSMATMVADTTVMAVMFSVSTLTFISFHVIRRHFARLDHVPIHWAISIVLCVAVWIAASAFTVFGLGAHDEHRLVDLPSPLVPIGHYALLTLLHISAIFAIFKIRRYNKKLQIDFQVNQAHQTLQLRTFLRRISKRTNLTVPILLLNSALWSVLLIADAVVDVVDRGLDDNPCSTENPIWEAVLDILYVLYSAVYPTILDRKRGPMKEQAKAVLCCWYTWNNDTYLASEGSPFTVGHGHWAAVQAQWNRVEQQKRTNGHKLEPIQIDYHNSSSRVDSKPSRQPPIVRNGVEPPKQAWGPSNG